MRVKLSSTSRKPDDRAMTELEVRIATLERNCLIHADIIDSLGHAVFCSWEWPTEEISGVLAPSDRSRKH